MDSNHRRRKPADLQSAPVGHLGNLPICSISSTFRGIELMLNWPQYPGIVSRAMRTMPKQAPGGSEKRTAHGLSKDGQWRSFSRVPPLLPFSSSGSNFAKWRAILFAKVSKQAMPLEVKCTPKGDHHPVRELTFPTYCFNSRYCNFGSDEH